MLAYNAEGRWEPGIGDPTIMGWVTVVAYFLAAILCWQAARRASRAGQPTQFWYVFTLGLVALGINKQLDLQTWLTLFFKGIAIRENIYEDRRGLQAAFIGLISLGGAVGLVGLKLLAGRLTKPVGIALAGGIFLATFVIVRAVSFHHVDQMLGMDLGGFRLNWLLELGGISGVAAGAWLARA
ncbi:MAG: hypothetical protein U1G07_01295 [Verrucomicrobiota bacterium]